jgi:hypothetical protein
MSHNPHADLLRDYLEQVCAEPGTAPPIPWGQWLRKVARASLILGAPLALAGCDRGGGGDPWDAEDGPEYGTGGSYGVGGGYGTAIYAAPMPTREAWCNDGVDDDFDGLIDCRDPDCSADARCVARAAPSTAYP